jgi:hypothetical protein
MNHKENLSKFSNLEDYFTDEIVGITTRIVEYTNDYYGNNIFI